MTYAKVKKFVDDKALLFVGFLFAGFCTFFTLGYLISLMKFD
jgi:hypothetical protein